MEETAANIRALILGMPAQELLGYIYAQRIMKQLADNEMTSEENNNNDSREQINELQFLLEYVHAVLASDEAPEEVKFDEEQCVELFDLSNKLRGQAMFFAMASSADNTKKADLSPDMAEMEFHIKSNWISLRGNRYQVLEGEFYRYVLEPHDDILKEVYGAGAEEIAKGFQDIANATRTGQADAVDIMRMQFEAAQNFAAAQEKRLEDVMELWVAENASQSEAVGYAIEDMFRGGIANVSCHTNLPAELLADLAYQRGEEIDFFAEGDFVGTPYRTLPARKKPLIQLETDYYAIDPCFARDAGYRALLFNLLQRKPDYKQRFSDRQKVMSEGAFSDILSEQLPEAIVYQEVYYKDPFTKQWSENDTLILVDDVLYLVEAKSGAAATIASPALDLKRHLQSIQDLVLKAYYQCKRFFNYINSAEEVPLYKLIGGRYEECGRIRQSDYRVMIPIGLTVESYSPFSTFCKELSEINPLLGKYSFISMSIDDLFVLKRILPTPGVFAHYMEVRQALAGIKQAHLFDEFDHLGAYITKNRVDQDLIEQFESGNADLIVLNDMSVPIDRNFEGESWETDPIPTQEFPEEILKLLGALDISRSPGWLLAESRIRNYGEQARKDLSKLLTDLRKTLEKNPARYFVFGGDSQPLFIWMQSSRHDIDWKEINNKASAAALCTMVPDITGLLVEVGSGSTYDQAHHFVIQIPTEKTEDNSHIFDEALRMNQRARSINTSREEGRSRPRKKIKIGRNETCPCGSGMKYKKCHGR
ncbi:YecA family protein [Gynuella sp.]|uniref:YecA family protein n=1 Tax=Gynuella sp. TaxID=2969146 RepID=UPI003D14ECD9